AAWEQIQQGLSNLREMVMEQIMTFVRDRIVVAAITRLVTSLNPAGAFIQAVIAIYNTVMFFVERLRQITQVAMSFIDSMAAIASGDITAAANRVEQTMAGLLTLVISFLARLVGLGRVSDVVVRVVDRIRAPIDRALDRVVDWIRARAQALLQRVAGGTPEERLNSALTAALRAVNRFAGRRVGAIVLRPILLGIKLRYGLRSLEPVQVGNIWAIRGEANPIRQRNTTLQAGEPTDEQINAAVTLAIAGRVIAIARYREWAASPDRYPDSSKTFAATASGSVTQSGFARQEIEEGEQRRLSGFVLRDYFGDPSRPGTSNVSLFRSLGYVMGATRPNRPRLPSFVEASSHAEKQLHYLRHDQPMGVSRDPCEDCQLFFRALARHTRHFQVIAAARMVRNIYPVAPFKIYIFHIDRDVEVRNG
ncbi:MAG TPA: hypothetical protein VFT26_02195, partial [Pyrinomonadaceae bacterium]|nr:hypothetical protein [Pyrinomonadaceae bacterium]